MPFPSEAPSIIPGKSNNCILQLLYLRTPGMHFNVVKSRGFTSEFVSVKRFYIVLLPTDGLPINDTRASPCFMTSKPSLGPVFFGGSKS